jgi:hypothetical protein
MNCFFRKTKVYPYVPAVTKDVTCYELSLHGSNFLYALHTMERRGLYWISMEGIWKGNFRFPDENVLDALIRKNLRKDALFVVNNKNMSKEEIVDFIIAFHYMRVKEMLPELHEMIVFLYDTIKSHVTI